MSERSRIVPADDVGLAKAIATLRDGGLVALPTDTVYGIAVGLDTTDGIERLFVAKGRPPDKAIAVLVDGLDQVSGIVDLPPAAAILAQVGWPGGLTIVLPLRGGAMLPAALTAGAATLGVRVPDHHVPRALARVLGPLPTTSANRSGGADALDAATVAETMGQAVDLILDGGRVAGGIASTVIDCVAIRPRLLRVGSIPTERLAVALDEARLEHDLRA
jgi:L-threonylcarbamoyladenylate synthase